MRPTKSAIQKEELAILMQEEASLEGWLYSAEDVDFYFNYFGQDIIAIKLDRELAGCVILHKSQGYVGKKPICSAGFLLVKKQYRGQQVVGSYLWSNFIRNDHFICFHSVLRAIHLYQRLGFKKTSLVNLFYTLDVNDVQKDSWQFLHEHIDAEIISISDSNITEFMRYNQQLFAKDNGIGFCDFLNHWQQRPDAITMAYFEQGIIKGYGVLTCCNEQTCYRLSPLYADSPDIAISLLKALVFHAMQHGAQKILLNSLADENTLFGHCLQQMGFRLCGKNFVVSNHAELIHPDAPILANIFASLPLEYAHEVVGQISPH